jgi:hypothetical protein
MLLSPTRETSLSNCYLEPVVTALLSSLSSLIPFLLILLISLLAFPQNPSVLFPCYALGHIPLTASLSSTPIVLTGILQSFSSWPDPTRLMSIPWSTLPSATNVSALLTTLIVVINELSSYLLILSFISMDLLLIPFFIIPLCFSYI